MRLRNKPWAQKLVAEHPEAILNEPDPDKKINWEERFDDFSKPLAIEIGSGKGQFITTLAKEHPEMNFIGVELQFGRVQKRFGTRKPRYNDVELLYEFQNIRKSSVRHCGGNIARYGVGQGRLNVRLREFFLPGAFTV